MITVKKLLWDKWNIEHIARHNVIKEEVEIVGQKIIYAIKSYDNKIRIVGRVEKRILSIILSPQEKSGIYYVVTARDAGKKERKAVYEIEAEEKNT